MTKLIAKFLCFVSLLSLLASCGDSKETFDTRISNALLVDGLGNAARPADIYLRQGLIARITLPGELDAEALNTIDAAGRVVAPGFIDVHSHGDPLQTPEFENFLAQGVTTITLGQDGDSPELEDLGGWVDEVNASGVGVNIAMFFPGLVID